MPTVFSSLALCGLEDVYSRLNKGGVQVLVNAGSSQSADAVVLSQIDLTKDYIRQRLIANFRQSYPNTVDAWLNFSNAMVQKARAQITAAIRASGVDTVTLEHILSFTRSAPILITDIQGPKVFLNAGTPESTTQAGNAANGDILINTSAWIVYQNRGTLSTPTWTAWDPDGFINYILNPTELTRAAVTGVILALYENGTLQDNGDYKDNIGAYENTKKRLSKQFEEELSLALSIIQIDASGDGLISDFERTRLATADYGFS